MWGQVLVAKMHADEPRTAFGEILNTICRLSDALSVRLSQPP
jgi:hypothetical protein